MKKTYPVILQKDSFGYLVKIPDLDTQTQGRNLSEAISMARDAISILGITIQDENGVIPEPRDIKKIKKEEDEIITLVDVDFFAYRQTLEKKSVKKNCTLPAWLNKKAEEAGINFSKTLQKALLRELESKTTP